MFLYVSCNSVAKKSEMEKSVQSVKLDAVPKDVKDAMQVLLSNNGNHPSPMPKNIKKAYDTLHLYDKPEEEHGKTKTDGSYSKSYYFRKCKIRWTFSESAKGIRRNSFNRSTFSLL